jgi:3-hydroxyacyl-CoA dehydrogenase/enoyl-CoA hydratase/3-hydroxybutyryl-CoA epimerase
VAAINGHCLGGGLELALACRVRIAADPPATLIGLPETAIGLIPAWGGTVRLARLIGFEAAVPLLLGSLKVSPQEALRRGMIDQVVPAGELFSRARQVVLSADGAGMSTPSPRLGGSCEDAIRQAAARAAPLISSHDVSRAAVDRLIEVLITVCRGGFDAGLDAERRAGVELFDAAECRERLERFIHRR